MTSTKSNSFTKRRDEFFNKTATANISDSSTSNYDFPSSMSYAEKSEDGFSTIYRRTNRSVFSSNMEQSIRFAEGTVSVSIPEVPSSSDNECKNDTWSELDEAYIFRNSHRGLPSMNIPGVNHIKPPSHGVNADHPVISKENVISRKELDEKQTSSEPKTEFCVTKLIFFSFLISMIAAIFILLLISGLFKFEFNPESDCTQVQEHSF